MSENYYRGSGSYEIFVKNKLNALKETSGATTSAINKLETTISNELQGIRNDIQASAVGMFNMGMDIRNDIQESTYSIVASQKQLQETFGYGFDSVNNTLNFGFTLLNNKINILSSEISSKIDKIHDILNNPRLTQSRELYREALISYKKGFYEEALEDCIGAVEKNKTDFISWYLLGMIYLQGAGKFSNVINLEKAEEAFLNAAKYIDPDIEVSKEAKLLASEIYYYLGHTQLLRSNDYLLENKNEDSNKKLIEAEKSSDVAHKLSNENLMARYEHAKELHFLRKDEEALQILENLIRKEKNFAIRAANDNDFKALWEKINDLISRLRDELVNEIIRKYDFDLLAKKLRDYQQELLSINMPTKVQLNELKIFYDSKLNDYNYKSFVQFTNNQFGGENLFALNVYKNLSCYMENNFELLFSEECEAKKTLQETIFLLENKKESLLNLFKSDYFSVVEEFNNLEDSLVDYDLEYEKNLKIIMDFIKTLSVVKSFFNAREPWEEKEREEKEREEKEREERKIYKKKQRCKSIAIGSVIGLIAGLIIGLFLFFSTDYYGELMVWAAVTVIILSILAGIFIGFAIGIYLFDYSCFFAIIIGLIVAILIFLLFGFLFCFILDLCSNIPGIILIPSAAGLGCIIGSIVGYISYAQQN